MEKKYIAPVGDLEETVTALQEAKEKGEHVYCKFNGYELDSDTVTMDSAYEAITGDTREVFLEKLEKEREARVKEIETRKEEFAAKAPLLIEQGEKIIFPEKHSEWAEYIDISANGMYYGKDVEAALEVMEKLANGASMDEVKETFFGQGHSGWSEEIVRQVVTEFSSRGPEFYEATIGRELSSEEKESLDAMKERNAELMELHKGDSAKTM